MTIERINEEITGGHLLTSLNKTGYAQTPNRPGRQYAFPAGHWLIIYFSCLCMALGVQFARVC